MAALRFFLTSYTIAEPFSVFMVNVVASNGIDSAAIPCEAATMTEVLAKKAELGQPAYDHNTVAAVCADKLGVPVTAGMS